MNKKIILSILLLIVCANAEEPYNSFIERWEGRQNKIYVDSLGNPSIGVGFNLKTANEKLKKLVKAQSGSLSDEQIDYWLEREIINAQNIARENFVTFDFQPLEIKFILVDLCYNLGNRIGKFVKFKEAIDNYDYKTAVSELKNSKWFRQVGERGIHHVFVLNVFSR